MKTRIHMISLCGLLFMSSCAFNQSKSELGNELKTIQISTPDELRSYFEYAEDAVPLISGHRGGNEKGFPENSLETFENTLRNTPATFEVDPRLTQDSVIILIHDDSLSRTTTGSGKVADYTWSELQKLYLKDADGNETNAQIPTLEEAIRWAKGKTILILDEKDVPKEMTARLITEMGAEAYVMITVHNAEEALFYYRKNRNFMFEAFVKTQEALLEYEKAGIPWSHIMAYVGSQVTPENRIVIDMLHERGVMCMVSAAPTDDKRPTPEERGEAYRQIIRQGVDMIESDRPIEVAKAISTLLPEESRKTKFFGTMNIEN